MSDFIRNISTAAENAPIGILSETLKEQLSLEKAQPPRRILFIDGLRGIAASVILLPHFVGFFATLPPPSNFRAVMLALGDYGHRGVDIFFVISGFVIMFTSRKQSATHYGVMPFMLRRLARLAPPYWVSMALMLIVLGMQGAVRSENRSVTAALSELKAVLPVLGAHLFYLQDLLNVRKLNPVYWTLCIEVQFYLVFILALAAWRRLQRHYNLAPFVAPTLLSLSWAGSGLLGEMTRLPVPGTFLPHWHEFALGILACWIIEGEKCRVALRYAIPVLSIGLIWGLGRERLDLLVSLVVFSIVLACGRRHTLSTVLDSKPLQHLGAISYSLYLVHVPVGFVILALAARWHGISPGISCAFFSAAVLGSLLLAQGFHLTVERQAIAWSRRISGRGSPSKVSESNAAPVG